MRRSTVAALVAAAGLVVPGAAAVGNAAMPAQVQRAAPKPVAVTQAAVLTTPQTVKVAKNGKSTTVRVQYQCSNNKLYKHYVTGLVQQGSGDDAVTYSTGFRNESGTRTAKCTGKLVTENLKLDRSWWTETQGKVLKPGPAELTFTLSRHNAQGSGWYTVHSTASVAKTISVLKG